LCSGKKKKLFKTFLALFLKIIIHLHFQVKNRNMKRIITVIVAAVFAIGISSCTKCKTCSFTYSIDGNEETTYFVEECGKKKDLDKYEADIRRQAAIVGGVVTCTEE